MSFVTCKTTSHALLSNELTDSDRLRSSLLLHHHTLDVDLRDLAVWNEELGQKVQETPGDMIPLVSHHPTGWTAANNDSWNLHCSSCPGYYSIRLARQERGR